MGVLSTGGPMGGFPADGNYYLGNQTVQVTIQAGQKVWVQGSCILGTSSTTTDAGFNIDAGYQDVSTPGPVKGGNNSMNGVVWASAPSACFSVNEVFANLPAGTYNFGIVVASIPGNGALDEARGEQVSVTVLN